MTVLRVARVEWQAELLQHIPGRNMGGLHGVVLSVKDLGGKHLLSSGRETEEANVGLSVRNVRFLPVQITVVQCGLKTNPNKHQRLDEEGRTRI